MNSAREVDIILNFLADTSEARQMSEEMQNITQNANQAAQAAGNMSNHYSDGYAEWRAQQNLLTQESRAMQQEMSRGWMQNSAAYGRALNDMVAVRYGYYLMARAGTEYNGTTRQMMNQVTTLGAQQRRINDQMINNDTQLRQSFLETAGTMANMTTQAARISANYDRMGNPMYLVNRGNLAIADGLNRIANSGNAATLALEMLGPTASTKQLNDMVMMINQGLMRMQQVALGAAISNLVLFYAMHQLSKGNEEYASSLTAMLQALLKAIQPMLNVFMDIAKNVFGFIESIANMVVAFNEANPVLARFIQGMFLIAVPLTLLLSPLAIGIGLMGGFRAALFAVWGLLGPAITGIAAMSATVWVLAAALIGLYMYFKMSGETADAFRAKVDGAISTVVGKVKEMLALIPDISEWGTVIENAFQSMIQGAQNALNGDFSGVIELFKTLAPTIIGLLVGGIPGLLIAASRFLPAIADGIMIGDSSLWSIITEVLDNIVATLTANLPKLLEAGVQILTMLAQGIQNNLPLLQEIALAIINGLMQAFTILVPQLLTVAQGLLMGIAEGIVTFLPLIIPAIFELLSFLVQTITEFLPIIIMTGADILMTLVQGIVDSLPLLVEAALGLINLLLQTIVSLLPQLLAMGMTILIQISTGILQMLPQIIAAAVSLITSVIVTIVTMLPQILAMGVQLVGMIAQGILDAVVTAVNAIGTLITGIFNKFTETDFLSIGSDIISGIVSGITGAAESLYKAAGNIATGVADKFKGFFGIASPSKLFKEYGGFLTEGLSIGMVNEVPKLQTASNYVASNVTDGFSEATANNDYATPMGGNSTTNSPTVNINIGGEAAGAEYQNLQDMVMEGLNEFFNHQTTVYSG